MTAFITKECPTLMIQEKKSKVVFIALFSLLIFLVLHQTSPAITQTSGQEEVTFIRGVILEEGDTEYENYTNETVLERDLKNADNKDLFNPSLEIAKRMTTEQLGQLVMSNCRLTNHIENESPEDKYLSAIRTVAKGRTGKNYKWFPVKSGDKILSFCLNTKTGSTYLRKNVLTTGRRKLLSKATNENLVNAFMVVREPMHRFLSAYLQKLKECRNYPRTCQPWKTFAMNIAQYVKNVNKRESSLFDAHLDKVEAYQVSFSDFTDYVIHMYLKNDGAIMNPEPDIATPIWTWWHWQSVVQDRCFACSAIWKDVVLFENLEQHLQQVLPKYPALFRNPEKLPAIKNSKTDDKVILYFQELSDSQLWFLGNVMYALDYAILPYDFSDFCKSIKRFNVSKPSIKKS